jgi:hypothetical protein
MSPSSRSTEAHGSLSADESPAGVGYLATVSGRGYSFRGWQYPVVGPTLRDYRLPLFSDVRRSQAEPSAVDLVRNDALMERFAGGFIQAQQKRGDALIVPPHECGEQSLIVHGDGRAFYRCRSPQRDVTRHILTVRILTAHGQLLDVSLKIEPQCLGAYTCAKPPSTNSSVPVM